MVIKIEKHPGCIQACLDIMGDKWTALIIRDLTTQKARFGDLEASLDGISPRTLSQRLDKLEKEQIIEKHLYCQHPPRYTYELTKKGKELQEILVKMSDWGARHHRYQHIA
jgi:DNA-binding HxlR family transcriptional regulator